MTGPDRPPRDPVAAIKRLYFDTTPATVQRDLERAIDLFTHRLSEADQERVAVYMDGLSQMRSEWARPRRGRAKR